MKSRRGARTARVLAFVTAAASSVLGCASAPPPPAASAPPPVCSPAASSAPDPALAGLTNEQVVRKVLELTGASRLGKQVADGMLDNLRKMPDLPPEFLDRFQRNIHTEELIDLMVPIYLKHYDRETLLAAIAFYQSDHGQALVNGLPAVTAESMETGRAWGTTLANKTLRELGITPPGKP
jgi:hypothetical protein